MDLPVLIEAILQRQLLGPLGQGWWLLVSDSLTTPVIPHPVEQGRVVSATGDFTDEFGYVDQTVLGVREGRPALGGTVDGERRTRDLAQGE